MWASAAQVPPRSSADADYSVGLGYLEPSAAVLHGSVGRAHSPLPRSGSCDADGLRASQLQHAVQRIDGNLHFGRPTLVRAAAQPVADHLLEPADSGFDAGSDVVAGRLLPGR